MLLCLSDFHTNTKSCYVETGTKKQAIWGECRMHPCVACYDAVSLHTSWGHNSKPFNTASNYRLRGMYKEGGTFFESTCCFLPIKFEVTKNIWYIFPLKIKIKENMYNLSFKIVKMHMSVWTQFTNFCMFIQSLKKDKVKMKLNIIWCVRDKSGFAVQVVFRYILIKNCSPKSWSRQVGGRPSRYRYNQVFNDINIAQY